MAREVRLIFISSADSGNSAGTLSKAISFEFYSLLVASLVRSLHSSLA